MRATLHRSRMNVREQLLDAGSSGAVVPPREGARNGWDGWATVPEGIPRWTRIGIGGLRPLSTGLKPIADEIRKMPPFASPKRQGSTSKRGEATEESRVVRLIDPKAEAVPVSIDIGDGGIIRRFGFQECMDGPAPLASVRPPAALREVRMNGVPRSARGGAPPPRGRWSATPPGHVADGDVGRG